MGTRSKCVIQVVYKEVIVRYGNSCIALKKLSALKYDLEKLLELEHHKSFVKDNKG